MSHELIKEKVRTIFRIQAELRGLAPAWTWKNFVGDYGEYYASNQLGLKKLPTNTKGGDHETKDGRIVSVKTRTNRNGKIELTGHANLLLVLLLNENSEIEIIYYGDYLTAQKTGKLRDKQRDLTLAQLRKLANETPQVNDQK